MRTAAITIDRTFRVLNKVNLSERDICTQYITPALQWSGLDFVTQVREEVTFTKGRVIVRGKLH